jgi:sarcosine oxidase subunit gamma
MAKGGAPVSAPAPVRRSPLGATSADPVRIAAAAGVEIWELPFTTQLNLRVDPEPAAISAVATASGVTLSTAPNRVATGSGVRAIWLGPDEWLIVEPADEGSAAVAVPAARALGSKRAAGSRGVVTAAALGAAVARAGGSVIDVSAHRTVLRIAGPRAAEILAHGCSIDLHPRAFEAGACAQTLLARVDVILERTGPEDFEVFVRSSFAAYLVDWLRNALGSDISAAAPKRAPARRTKASPTP